MKIDKGKITEISEVELFELYLLRDIDDCYSFYEYMTMFKATGAKITKDD
jgi:hypothetical protein